MWNLLFGGLKEFVSTASWVILIAAIIVYLACFAIRKVSKVPLPSVALFEFWAGAVAAVMGAIKLLMLIGGIITAQDRIEELDRANKGLKLEIKELEDTVKRKETQAKEVSEKDKEIDTRYVPVYRNIETIREVPDLSLANKLALDLVNNFYEPEASSNAEQAEK